MTGSDLGLLLALAGVALALCALAVVALGARRARRERDHVRDRLDALTARLDADAVRRDHTPHDQATEDTDAAEDTATGIETSWVITTAGETHSGTTGSDSDPDLPTRIEGRLFADVVLRESVVKAAALGHGLRRAMRPETRNRIRFEMKQEVKRSRKQRLADEREARREFEAFQRRRAQDAHQAEGNRQEGAA